MHIREINLKEFNEFKKNHPLSGKYGVPQKLAYLMVAVAILFMGYTGFCLWTPWMDFPLFAGFTMAVGGLMKVRIIHYFMMFFFICFTILHVYLALIEGIEPALIMFFHKEHGGLTYDLETMNISGEDRIDEAPEKIDYLVVEEEEVVEEA